MRNLSLILALSLLLAGCCKPCRQAAVHQTDSVRVEYSIVEVPDTVLVTLPIQEKERTTPDTVSELRTDYAESLARINPDGTLYHNLKSRVKDLPVPVNRIVETRDSIVYKEREKLVPEPYPVEVPGELTLWQRFRLNAFWWLVAAALALAAWTFRKPLLRFISIIFS